MRAVVAARAGECESPVEALSAWLEANPEHVTVATFHPLAEEPDLSPLIRAHPERTWVFPKVIGDDLEFYIVADPPAELRPGTLGIMEPGDACPHAGITGIDAFLCPGLAFDTRGGRLGRGKGFYDRALCRARGNAVRIGVCFPYQIVPDTFPQSHDVAMNLVICRNLKSTPAP